MTSFFIWMCDDAAAALLAAMHHLVPALQQRLMSAVQAEQEQEQLAIKKLYQADSLRQLQRDGLVLLQLHATPSHVLYRSMVWRFRVSGQPGKDLPYHRFRQGDSLLVSRCSQDQVRVGTRQGIIKADAKVVEMTLLLCKYDVIRDYDVQTSRGQ